MSRKSGCPFSIKQYSVKIKNLVTDEFIRVKGLDTMEVNVEADTEDGKTGDAIWAENYIQGRSVSGSIGGKPIIKKVGIDMVQLEQYQGFAAALSATGALLLATLTGLPVSTTHTSSSAMMGAGAAKDPRSVDWDVAKEMVLTWVFTFPGCGLIGFVLAKLFLLVF